MANVQYDISDLNENSQTENDENDRNIKIINDSPVLSTPVKPKYTNKKLIKIIIILFSIIISIFLVVLIAYLFLKKKKTM